MIRAHRTLVVVEDYRRLLLGADPTDRPEDAATLTPRQLAARHRKQLTRNRDAANFDAATDMRAKRFLDLLAHPQVEVRRFTGGFLHGKLYLTCAGPDHPTGALVGSSNLTLAGLTRNRELNLGRGDTGPLATVVDWFETHWAHSDDYRGGLDRMYRQQYEPPDPHMLSLRMLHAHYGHPEPDRPSGDRRLARFQADGAARARRILARYGGVLLADSTGLGKTHTALELVRDAVEGRRQQALIVAPRALQPAWRQALASQQVDAALTTYDRLAGDLDADPGRWRHIQMVVIDEAHAYRNADTRRADALERLLAGRPAKDVVLVTATPVNNRLGDLEQLLSYFLADDALADHGIPSVAGRFAALARTDPARLTAADLADLLDAVAVRRTRGFVARHYPDDRIGTTPLVFPDVRLQPVSYRLSVAGRSLFADLAAALSGDGDRPLTLARYQPDRYRTGQADPGSGGLDGLFRSMLVKRFESSAAAFAATCQRLADSHQRWLDGLAATGRPPDRGGADLHELDDPPEPDDDDGDGDGMAGAGWDVAALTAAAAADQQRLAGWAAQAAELAGSHDPKLAALLDVLTERAAHDEPDARKAVVFAHAADTVLWLAAQVADAVAGDPQLACYRGRIAVVAGADAFRPDRHGAHIRFGDQSDAAADFAPRTAGDGADLPGGSDLLLTTDTLAEGVNLQQAGCVINYDLTWNPMRLVQRHGRIDRLGSRHQHADIAVFLPDRDLDAILTLVRTLHDKLAAADAAVGTDTPVLPGHSAAAHSHSDPAGVVAGLAAGDTRLLTEGGRPADTLTGDTLRRELADALNDDPRLADELAQLPAGAGVTVDSPDRSHTTVVYLCRVAGQDRMLLRAATSDPDRPDRPGHIDRRAAAALAAVRSGPGRPAAAGRRQQAGRRLAQQWWPHIQAGIAADLAAEQDPQHGLPPARPVQQQAARLLSRAAGRDPDGGSRYTATADVLSGPQPSRILRRIRRILTEQPTEVQAADDLAALVDREGLRRPARTEPSAPAGSDQIALAAWMTLLPASGQPDGSPAGTHTQGSR